MAQNLIGLPAILMALRLGGQPGKRPQFQPLAGIPAQDEFLASGSGDLLGSIFSGLVQGLSLHNEERKMADFWKTALVSNATTGDQTVVAAVANKRICVSALHIAAAAAATVTFKSATTAITGAMTLATGIPHTQSQLGRNGPVAPILRTNPGQALVINNGTVQVSGFLTYYLEDAET